MIEDENFNPPRETKEREKYSTRDGITLTLEELQNEFLKLTKNSKNIPEEKIRFLIGVFLVDKKIFSRTELDSMKARDLIGRIYDFYSHQPETGEILAKSNESWEIRSARFHQLREERRAGQNYRESDLE